MDLIYIAILVGCGLLSLAAAGLVRLRFAQANKVPVASGMTGADAAWAIVRSAGLEGVTVVEHQGFLSDHYNPMTRTLALSPDVYRGRTAAAVGVAAHEAGHAIQHAEGYAPMWMRSVLVPVANIGSALGPWLVIGGALLGGAAAAAPALAGILMIAGVAMFACATLFTLVTVPVEFDASRRAKLRLEDLGIVSGHEERDAVRSVLTAAGLTYVAAAISAVAQLIYWAWRAGLIGGQNRQ